jgi:uncharacterized protein (TIGR00255 family)
MTAFGHGDASLNTVTVSVDVRTVNGKYLDVNPRLPRELAQFESDIRKAVKAKLDRGRVDLYFSLEIHATDQYKLNAELVQNYRRLSEEAKALGFQGEVSVESLMQLPGVLVSDGLEATDDCKGALLEATEQALTVVRQVRDQEGRALRDELRSRLRALEKFVAEIESSADGITEHFRARLNEKIESLQASGPVEEGRLAQEVLFYSERADIAEEVTRLRLHMERFGELVTNGEGAIGKNLDFLCQELNREMNTIVSKSALPGVSETAVAGKVEIEKIREQVQNVE